MYIFNEVNFKVVRKENELVIESEHGKLDEFEKDVFMKCFNFGEINITGKEHKIINGEIYKFVNGEIYKNKD
jgi:hypothetical protein